jgi:acyl-coenzyme A synthetase/AMP-(fatty) acid ligase
MPPELGRSLRELLSAGVLPETTQFFAAGAEVALSRVLGGTALRAPTRSLAGASILVATRTQLDAALALIELDGVARRIVLCPPDLAAAHIPAIAAAVEATAVVTDEAASPVPGLQPIVCGAPQAREDSHPGFVQATEWVLLTSGTTGVPKTVVHTLEGLTGAIKPAPAPPGAVVWSTFYDIRRYGGLQIFLRAMAGRTSLILSDAAESTDDFLVRLGAKGVTHISGTPSHWRRALMSPRARAMAPRYVRLSGEIADQAVLDALHATYPDAAVGHAYASTEAGVGFDVNDGLEGIPAAVIDASGPEVEMKVEEGSLRIRSRRTASRYLGAGAPALMDEDGFVDTGDMLERRGDRYYFVGRRGGIINVGGQKVHPEEVEAVINGHAGVRMSRVSARRNPITGALVVAEVVLDAAAGDRACDATKQAILADCRAALPPHKVPATIRFVDALAVLPSGKLARPHG